MAGRPAKLEQVKKKFLDEVVSARNLTDAIYALPKKINPKVVTVGIHPKHETKIVELAFIGLIAAWEEFLERTLVRYVAGAMTESGYAPIPKFGLAINIGHAYQILTQDSKYDPQKQYLKGNDAKWVWSSADFFFSTHTYSCLSSKNNLLLHATAIRNRIAHDSEKCKSDFKSTAIDFLHPTGGKLKQSYGPGNLLMAKVARHFSQSAIDRGLTHFRAYTDLFESLAKTIVP